MTLPIYTPANSIPLIFVMGATNVGKSTLMTAASTYGTEEEPTYSTITNELVAKGLLGLVEVGKKMRAKYPPDYFKGQGAPAHTQAEAWQMMLDGVLEASALGKIAAVIDGQPRNIEQTQWALDLPNPKAFLHLWAPPDVRRERAFKRDVNDPAKINLNLKRLDDDPRVLFDCMAMIQLRKAITAVENTNDATYDPDDVITNVLMAFGYLPADEDGVTG